MWITGQNETMESNMSNPRPRMNYLGTHGTTYDDWSKDLIQHHGKHFTLERDGDAINAYIDEEPVGSFNFKQSTGFVVRANETVALQDIGSRPNFQEMSLDDIKRH